MRARIGAVRIGDVRQQRFRLFHAGRIVGTHRRAHVPQGRDQGDRGRFAHVVRVRLEGEPEHGDGLAAQIAAERGRDLAAHGALALVVHRHDGLDDAQWRLVILPGLDQGERVLGKARPAEAGTGVQELGADPIVEADAARNLLHVGADLFA